MQHHKLAEKLRLTAARLTTTNEYKWTHQGRCNCGFLAQTLTGNSAARIHQLAVQSEGEWVDHAAAYCEKSGLPIDQVIKEMLSFGLTVDELSDLEHLRAIEVLRWMPIGQKHPDYRRKEDVIAYFGTWAQVLDAKLALAQTPNAEVRVNGRVFTPEKRDRIPMALDENPDAGLTAA
jgi:hypothetical protein